MLEVQKKVDGLFSFFHDEIEQEVHVNFNIERCKVFSVFQRLGKKESRFNLSTCIDFGKSIMEAVASSDGPCSLVFCSQKLFSNNEFIVAISNDDLCPIRISSITRWYPPKSAIHLKGSVIFKALPFSGDVFDKSFFDYQTSTSFMNRLLTLRLDTFKHLSYFILEGILKTRPLISANIFYNKHQHAINKSNILMEYQWKGLKMDIVANLRNYVEVVLTNINDMKVLLLDEETSHMVSLVYTQSELLQHDVVLIESLQKRVSKPVDKALSILQCVVLVRPTQQNIHDLCSELNCPHFSSYYIFFTNTVSKEYIRQISFADHSTKVNVVHEIFLDVFALNKKLFSLGVKSCLNKLNSNTDNPVITRIVDGLFSVLCAFKTRAAIKFDTNSNACKLVGEFLSRKIDDNKDLFQTMTGNSLLLLIDRRTDPLTPLLHAWTYQSLIHEFLGINNNIITISGNKSVVVDESSDSFFAENLYSNYGELGEAQKNLVQSVQAQHTDVQDIKDVDALKKFIHNYPLYQQKQALASKHAEILGEISNRIKNENLFQFAPLEQSIAVENNITSHHSAVISYINDMNVTNDNALRISILYCLRYSNSKGADIDSIKSALYNRPNGEILVSLIDKFIEQFPKTEQMFSTKSILSKAKNLIGLDESQNKFMQYTPQLYTMLQKLSKGQMDAQMFQSIKELPPNSELQRVIVFYVGGATYEEGRIAYASNDMNVIVGGTTIHNMHSFVYEEIGSE
ncbi:Vacuolar protein sorting-associated protein 45 [Histomonas meleagridis]|uniref:Vacuolar protein sorting-associated protein 45 n=1 Tax=Histomonas meleagridis TaxID=135588 RepID=UPI0035595DF2|nr:Vacuolar protein sorting-associated protein 45 [Histomonas meleagridis]KAH0801741.1 Vacuolar protein sorting-associated protein 45 [Histomonas meleagridis]